MISRYLLIACTLFLTGSNALRPLPEYQGAVLKVMNSFLSPANKEQADSVNSTLLAEDIIIRGEW
jgi:hypothetical protein